MIAGKRTWVLIPVGVAVLLIALLVDREGGSGGDKGAASAGTSGPERFSRDRAGAQRAAVAYAAALGGEEMFRKQSRHAVVRRLVVPDEQERLLRGLDADYGPELMRRIGLRADGRVPDGARFAARSMPAGTTMREYGAATATVEVWCAGLIALSGTTADLPARKSWFTMTVALRWGQSGWKIKEFEQEDGPTPERATEYGQAPDL